MLHHCSGGLAGKKDCEFFTSHSEGLTSSCHARKVAGDHAKDFVSSFMSEGVVDALEVVDIDSGYRVRCFQLQSRIIKSAA